MSIQEEQREIFKENFENTVSIFRPLKAVYTILSSAVVHQSDDVLPETLRSEWVTERDEISRKPYYIHNSSHVGRERFREVGWYEFFDGDRGQLYYSKLGEAGWEITTWKRPHEKNIRISRGSKSKMIIVKWQKPKESSRLSKSKIKFLEERLFEFDLIMDKLRRVPTSENIDYPSFYCFKDVIAEILKISMSHSLLEFKVDEHADKIRKELIRRILKMPRKTNFNGTDKLQVKVGAKYDE